MPPPDALNVRVVPIRERRWPSWALGIAGGLSLLMLCASYGPHDPWVLRAAGILGATWILGQLASWRPRPSVVRVQRDGIGVRLGSEVVMPKNVRASIVEARSGASVALVWDDGQVFVETATTEDAERLATMCLAERVNSFDIRLHRRWLRALKALVATIGAIGCLVLGTQEYDKSVFGLILACGAVTSGLHILEALTKRTVTISSAGRGYDAARGSIRDHVLLHLRREVVKRDPPMRVRVIDRGEEPVRQWIERLDTLASDAYRGDLPSQDDLRAVFGDETAPLHQRLAAARLLVRRYAVPVDEIHQALTPDLVPYFLEVDNEDPARVAANVERLGPAFRA